MNPFAVLGIDARPDLTDAEVREAWRALAAATHPDRPDGGNPDAYAAASAAYAALRTPWARSEAYADLLARTTTPEPPPPATEPPPQLARLLARAKILPARLRHGRPLRTALRMLGGALLIIITLHSGAGTAPTAGTLTGIALWLALTLPRDIAPPPDR